MIALRTDSIKHTSAVGRLILLIGWLMAVPLLTLLFYPQDIIYAPAFIVPSLFSIVLGIIICLCKKNTGHYKNFCGRLKASSLTVLFAWLYGFAAGAAPFVLSGKLNFLQALFESVSGFTTTGLSVMDVSATAHIFLFHRSFMQFCGGLGFVMMMLAFIQEKNSMNLYSAEGHPDRLMPSIGKTARIILIMYTAFLIGGTLLYVIFGMNVFDSVNHAMGALSTGGFSTRADSIGTYHSMPIELVTIILMLIGTTNFAVLLLFVQRRFYQALKVSELRFLGVLLAVFVPALGFMLTFGLYSNFGTGLRTALFNAVSALSTSGFSTVSYSNWPQGAVGVMIILMIIGGGIGSTAGGMKLTRVYILCRTALDNIRNSLSSQRGVSKSYFYTAQGKTMIDSRLISKTTGFAVMYMLIYIIGTLSLSAASGCSLTDAMFEFASALGTVGLSVGVTSADASAAALIIEMCGMFLGRLEIFIVFIAVLPQKYK